MDVGVFGLIKNTEGEILLVRDATRQQLWTMPGGGVNFRELIPEALKREIKEETTLNATVQKLLGVFSQQKTPGIVLLFSVSVESGEAKPDGIETSACVYFTREEMIRMRDEIKPAQLSMICQVLDTSEYPIFNSFPVSER